MALGRAVQLVGSFLLLAGLVVHPLAAEPLRYVRQVADHDSISHNSTLDSTENGFILNEIAVTSSPEQIPTKSFSQNLESPDNSLVHAEDNDSNHLDNVESAVEKRLDLTKIEVDSTNALSASSPISNIDRPLDSGLAEATRSTEGEGKDELSTTSKELAVDALTQVAVTDETSSVLQRTADGDGSSHEDRLDTDMTGSSQEGTESEALLPSHTGAEAEKQSSHEPNLVSLEKSVSQIASGTEETTMSSLKTDADVNSSFQTSSETEDFSYHKQMSSASDSTTSQVAPGTEVTTMSSSKVVDVNSSSKTSSEMKESLSQKQISNGLDESAEVTSGTPATTYNAEEETEVPLPLKRVTDVGKPPTQDRISDVVEESSREVTEDEMTTPKPTIASLNKAARAATESADDSVARHDSVFATTNSAELSVFRITTELVQQSPPENVGGSDKRMETANEPNTTKVVTEIMSAELVQSTTDSLIPTSDMTSEVMTSPSRDATAADTTKSPKGAPMNPVEIVETTPSFNETTEEIYPVTLPLRGRTDAAPPGNATVAATLVPNAGNISSLSVLIPMAPDRTDVVETAVVNGTEECPDDNKMPCVAKCCPYGEKLSSDGCIPSKVRFIPQFTVLIVGDSSEGTMENKTDVKQLYNLVANNICPNNRYRLEPFTDENDEFYLLFNGSLWMPRRKPHILYSTEYCMEVFDLDGEERMLPLVCFEEPDAREASYHFIVYPVGLLISVPFLFATFLVYVLIPELHTLPGKALACYVFSLMTAYIFLAVVQLGGSELQDDVCVAVAFVIQFAFIASFFWLNVLCFDTWRNVFFHGDMGHRLPKAKETMYFICYSLYAWSCTAVFIIVTMVMKFTPTIPSSYLKPGFGVKTCWFGTQAEAVPYFYAPIGSLILLNVVLFLATSIKVCRENHGGGRRGRTPKQTVKLCVTLFFMMGINWVMELISWAAGGPNFIWYITDICNTLQGIFIFIIFVMDTRVRELVSTSLLPRCGCQETKFQPGETSSQLETINGRVNTYRFNTTDEKFA